MTVTVEQIEHNRIAQSMAYAYALGLQILQYIEKEKINQSLSYSHTLDFDTVLSD